MFWSERAAHASRAPHANSQFLSSELEKNLHTRARRYLCSDSIDFIMKFETLGKEKLAEAEKVAEDFVSKFRRKGVVGIVFLGGIARGYFEKFSDIDIVIFKRKNTKLGMKTEEEIEHKGFLIDYEITNCEDKLKSDWGMEERWGFSTAKIFYDPEGKIKILIKRKVHLRSKEKKWMILEGMTQSEWYCNVMSRSWVHRGDVLSAQHSINNALEELLKALFGLNNELLPAKKWQIYQSYNLKWLPDRFREKVMHITIVKGVSMEELQRRRNAMNYLWN